MGRELRKYVGSCHCGEVRFEIETDFPELTTCDCSICLRKNALMVKVHERAFHLLSGAQALTQVQEMTLTFVPKIGAILLVAVISAPFIYQGLSHFTFSLYDRIATGF